MTAKRVTVPVALDTALADLREQAEREHAAYPQYAGFWDGWVLGRIERGVRTKAGQAFLRGDIVLASPDTRPGMGAALGTLRTCYSWRTGMNTSVPDGSVRLVANKGRG